MSFLLALFSCSALLALFPAQPGVIRAVLAGIAGRSRLLIKEKDICKEYSFPYLYYEKHQ